VPEAWQKVIKDNIATRFDFLTKSLQGKPYLMGESFTVADGYLFTILNWTNFVKIDLGNWPALKAYQERIAARPAVRAALKAEGLVN
jgi:glutathione S-transferase